MDTQKRDALLRRIGAVNDKTQELPLVTLEEFFDGNDDGASIWCNLPIAPDPANVYRILKGIRDRSDVFDVHVMVSQYDGGQDEWPFSDTVYFVTTSTVDDVRGWLGEDYAPDEIWLLADNNRGEPITVPPGHSVVVGWWD